MPKKLPLIAVLTSILLAFAFRVIPGYDAVFSAHGVSFQEPDAWFHVRTIHNLVAHFPRRSGFDPYDLYPGGANITTAPFWDYFVGSIAWMAGAGSPSDNLIDEVSAWLPAILGALLPVPIFFLARRLFGAGAAMWSALFAAVIPGTLLWVSHLGMPDHHVAEIFASFVSLLLVCSASELEGRKRWIVSAFAGIALTIYLTTRAAGVFVPAILGGAAILAPELASIVAIANGTAWLLTLPAGGISPWSAYTSLSLFDAAVITASVAVMNTLGNQCSWPRPVLHLRAIALAVATMAVLGLAEIHTLRELFGVIHSHQAAAADPANMATRVTELQPLWFAAPGGFASLYRQFGIAWIPAIPGLGAVIWIAWRSRRAATILFALWSIVMIGGAILQLRMAAYAGLVVAILAGFSVGWIVTRVPVRVAWLRSVAAGFLVLAVLAGCLPPGFASTNHGQGTAPDLQAALEWLRWHTPEPMGDSSAWTRWWPRLDDGAHFTYPPSAYGVIALWDRGWQISGIARRIPLANGRMEGAPETSRFLTGPPDEARQQAHKSGARYAMVGPEAVTVALPSLVALSGRKLDEYSLLLRMPVDNAEPVPVRVYRPAFYRSMAARLYLFGGRRTNTTRGVTVFLTGPDKIIQSVFHFASEQEAEHWLSVNSDKSAYLASADASVSCVDLEELPWAKQVFASSSEQVTGSLQPTVVKIFELR